MKVLTTLLILVATTLAFSSVSADSHKGKHDGGDRGRPVQRGAGVGRRLCETLRERGATVDVVAAYDAPFPSRKFKAGARMFPALVPVRPDDPASDANRRAWDAFGRWEKPFLTAFSDKDPITRGGDRVWQKHVPGAQGQHHVTIEGAGHFLQEDKGEELAEALIGFCRATA